MSVRDEIRAAVASLALRPEQFSEVPEDEARPLFESFLSRFTGGVDRRWWWEHFTLPASTIRFEDGRAFTRLSALVPDAESKVWFVAEDADLAFFPVFDATPAAAQQVIGECYFFEYYLISKDLSWLLCENHHDTMFAVGTAVQRVQKMPRRPA